MAPIKFEDNLREKLEGREIEPSKNAWNKLSQQLDATSENKTNKVIWYAIAASIIGILIAVSVFSSRNDKTVENATDYVKIDNSERKGDVKEVVNADTNASEEYGKEISNSEELNSANKSEQVNSEIEKQIPKKKDSNLKNQMQNKSEAIAKISENSQNRRLHQLPEEDLAKVDLIIDKKLNDLVAEVRLIHQNNNSVSEDEIDALLVKAERDLQSKKAMTTIKIDPLTLLDDVETELDNSFREKVFTALGEGYTIIRTAVVNRNN